MHASIGLTLCIERRVVDNKFGVPRNSGPVHRPGTNASNNEERKIDRVIKQCEGSKSKYGKIKSINYFRRRILQ